MSNDEKINNFRKKVEEKKAQLGSRPNASYRTNLLLDIEGVKKLNLNTISTEEDCINIISQILTKSHGASLANTFLNTNIIFKIEGYPIDDWLHDLKIRYSIILWDTEKRKLTAMDNQLKELMSEGAKTAIAIDAIAKELE